MNKFQTKPQWVMGFRVTLFHVEGSIPLPSPFQEAVENEKLIPGKTARIDKAGKVIRFYQKEGTVTVKVGDWILDPFEVMSDEDFQATFIVEENEDG